MGPIASSQAVTCAPPAFTRLPQGSPPLAISPAFPQPGTDTLAFGAREGKAKHSHWLLAGLAALPLAFMHSKPADAQCYPAWQCRQQEQQAFRQGYWNMKRQLREQQNTNTLLGVLGALTGNGSGFRRQPQVNCVKLTRDRFGALILPNGRVLPQRIPGISYCEID